MNPVTLPDHGAADRRSNLVLLTNLMYGLHTLSFFSAGVFSVVATSGISVSCVP